MLTTEQMNERETHLIHLLTELEVGRIQCVEYGPLHMKDRESYYSYLRIRYMKTAGGLQFGIKILNRGVEGSGMYYTSLTSTVVEAQKLVANYHRPTELRDKLAAFRQTRGLTGSELIPELSNVWFSSSTEVSKWHRAAVAEVDGFMPQAVVTTLQDGNPEEV